jgi:hypothetical protein
VAGLTERCFSHQEDGPQGGGYSHYGFTKAAVAIDMSTVAAMILNSNNIKSWHR